MVNCWVQSSSLPRQEIQPETTPNHRGQPTVPHTLDSYPVQLETDAAPSNCGVQLKVPPKPEMQSVTLPNSRAKTEICSIAVALLNSEQRLQFCFQAAAPSGMWIPKQEPRLKTLPVMESNSWCCPEREGCLQPHLNKGNRRAPLVSTPDHRVYLAVPLEHRI